MAPRIAILSLAASALLIPAARAQMGPGLDLSWSSIDGGGGASAGGQFSLVGVIGQPDAGAMSGGAFELGGGFMPGIQVCYPDCNADGVLTVADFGCFQTKFVLADPYADCNADGGLTVADFGCFQTRFVVGCP